MYIVLREIGVVDCCHVILVIVYSSIDVYVFLFFFFFKQKTAYEMRISDWSSDVCSSDLMAQIPVEQDAAYIEDHALANHAAPMHAKAPPEASDGVTPKNLGTSKSKRGENTPRRGISPGAP